MAWFSYQHAALTAKMNQIPKHIWWCFRRQNEHWIGLDVGRNAHSYGGLGWIGFWKMDPRTSLNVIKSTAAPPITARVWQTVQSQAEAVDGRIIKTSCVCRRSSKNSQLCDERQTTVDLRAHCSWTACVQDKKWKFRHESVGMMCVITAVYERRCSGVDRQVCCMAV